MSRASLQERTGLWMFPLAVAATLVLLGFGLTLPIVSVERMLVNRDAYSILGSVDRLWTAGDHFLAGVIAVFSVGFPVIKLLGLLLVWFLRMSRERRRTWLNVLGGLGRWSMLDVFVVAILISSTASQWYFKVDSQAGVFVFCGAILTTAVLTHWASWLGKRTLDASELPGTPEVAEDPAGTGGELGPGTEG